MDAAERRPLLELKTIRTGRDRGKQVAKVSGPVEERAKRLGQERRVAYLIAIWTGLRRGEIRQLTWGDVDLDCLPPRIRLRAETTKSNRADSLVIHPQLADELRAFRPADAASTARVLRAVPGMKVLKADLKLAGIEYGDQFMGYADLHASRKSINTKMAVEGVTLRIRQAHMRHTDPRLTSLTYMDESLLPVAEAVMGLPRIPVQNTATTAPGAPGTEATGEGSVRKLSEYCQKGMPPARPDRAGQGVTGVRATGTEGRR